ncbi:hypothetical protein ACFXPW_08730 [Streptomyces goshikiensis]|uniref:hypothetical protein n=1 Tax=Streptomyces goshikiensis TaxID=1942 RepID=UPI0036796349
MHVLRVDAPELIILPVTALHGWIDDEPCADALAQEALGHAFLTACALATGQARHLG